MKKILLILTIVLAFASTEVFAATNIGPGLGRYLLAGKKGKVAELAGTFLNGLCGNGTFAISTGTLGYHKGATISLNSIDLYIAENMDALANDIAQGEGEYLDTLAHLIKAENKATFKNKLHKNFNKIYTSKNVTSKEVAANIKQINS